MYEWRGWPSAGKGRKGKRLLKGQGGGGLVEMGLAVDREAGRLWSGGKGVGGGGALYVRLMKMGG
jgi:hypothetical protein